MDSLWAKTNAGGKPHSLLGHLLDTAAVAELIWDRYMADITKRRVDELSEGRGRDLFVLCCAVHDVGKATPSFQVKNVELAALVVTAGLPLPRAAAKARWHHSHAGRAILEDYFDHLGLTGLGWVAVLVEGHHGRFDVQPFSRLGHGGAPWERVQFELVEAVERLLGVRWAELSLTQPSRSLQLEMSGFMVMADWIASCDLFEGLGVSGPADLAIARDRAQAAWAALGFAGQWRPRRLVDIGADFAARFGVEPRPFQEDVLAQSRRVESPGLVVIEAPMGEGKTELALALAEDAAARWGCNGILYAMPTQGTTDAMYRRCRRWAARSEPELRISLVHGKAMLNEEWREALESRSVADVYGVEDDYGMHEPVAEREWLLGRHRALLSFGVVCTVDHLLYAGTRTKFVMLRHAGLAGKVVVIDEVHSYDCFMATFLHEVLRWLGEAGIAVILMSATLPPEQRRALESAYSGALAPASGVAGGYPMAIWSESGMCGSAVVDSRSWRSDLRVAVEVLDGADSGVDSIAEAVLADLHQGGCGLVVLNTVARAQQVARLLRRGGLDEVELIHGRLTVAHRAQRTARAIDLLGAHRTRESGRPARYVVVATQIAEQSFDVDVDVLYSDLAPMDLLLQRVGRLHRHLRSEQDRPARFQAPRVVVAGMKLQADSVSYPREFAIYDPWLLLRTGAMVGGGATWEVPGQVPGLVARAYDENEAVTDWSAEADALALSASSAAKRRSYASSYLLGGAMCPDAVDLSGLHQAATADGDEHVVVRDGDPTLEVCLVVRAEDQFRTLGGRPIGPTGERCTDLAVAREVLGDAVRVRDVQAFRNLLPLPGWSGTRVLSTQRALELDADLRGVVGDIGVAYDPEYGLSIDWGHHRW